MTCGEFPTEARASIAALDQVVKIAAATDIERRVQDCEARLAAMTVGGLHPAPAPQEE